VSSPAELSVGYSDFRPVAGPAPPPDLSTYTLDRALRILRDGVRPEDCLPVTDGVRRVMAVEEAYFTERLGGTPPAAEYMRGLRVNYTLAAHLPEQHVVYLDDEHGVAVLAVGLGDVERLLRSVPAGVGDDMIVTYVDRPGTVFT
jgi:hypothetical protein